MYYILIFFCVIIMVIIHTYIMGKKKNNKSRINFCQFYRQNSKYYFPLKSTFPLLNYAFPDSSCEYYMMTFKYDKYNIMLRRSQKNVSNIFFNCIKYHFKAQLKFLLFSFDFSKCLCANFG